MIVISTLVKGVTGDIHVGKQGFVSCWIMLNTAPSFPTLIGIKEVNGILNFRTLLPGAGNLCRNRYNQGVHKNLFRRRRENDFANFMGQSR